MDHSTNRIFVLCSLVALVAAIALSGCESMVQPQAKVDTTMAQQSFNCPGKANVAVARFDWRVGGTGTTISTPMGAISIREENGVLHGLRDMLITSLVQTRCFRVLERQDFEALKQEMALRESGYTKKKTSRKGRVKEADLMIVAAITGWEDGTSGVSGGVGGLFGPVLGGIAGAMKKSSVAMDIRIVDVETTEVLAATRVEGTAKAISGGGLLGGLVGSVPMGGGLSAYAKTPMEKAIRSCIYEAVKYIVNNTPQEYFK